MDIAPKTKAVININDILAVMIIIMVGILFYKSFHVFTAPLSANSTISLNPKFLPKYAMLTVSRILLAMIISLIFAIIYATLAAKTKIGEKILVPLLDVLQSVPIFGYISFAVSGLVALFPGSVLGYELVAIFAIFTSQVWNMVFSVYQSFKSIPKDIEDACKAFKLTILQKFFKAELPYAIPSLIWNMMISMSGAWFFIVASEAISVGNNQIDLPGIGSYIASALARKNNQALSYAVVVLLMVIYIYNQLIFRPLVDWSKKFRYENTTCNFETTSWCYRIFSNTILLPKLFKPLKNCFNRSLRLEIRDKYNICGPIITLISMILLVKVILCLNGYIKYIPSSTEFIKVTLLGLSTLIRIILMLALSSLLWLPIGIYIGMRPNFAKKIQSIAQIAAALPSNILYPIFVILIASNHLNPDIWLSPLIIFGSQWYILFNVIAGATAFPDDLKEVIRNMRLKGWLLWKKILLPAVLPHFIIGAITAWGGAWNACIIAELISWGNITIQTKQGIGAYIANATINGAYPQIILGILVMIIYIIIFNRLLWRPLFKYAQERICYN